MYSNQKVFCSPHQCRTRLNCHYNLLHERIRNIPPLFIFPRQRMLAQLQKDGLPSAIYNNSKNGWGNENLFLIWLKHLAANTNPTVDAPVLLILDNHGSHISLGCNPQTQHFINPSKMECVSFMKTNAYQKITHYD